MEHISQLLLYLKHSFSIDWIYIIYQPMGDIIKNQESTSSPQLRSYLSIDKKKASLYFSIILKGWNLITSITSLKFIKPFDMMTKWNSITKDLKLFLKAEGILLGYNIINVWYFSSELYKTKLAFSSLASQIQTPAYPWSRDRGQGQLFIFFLMIGISNLRLTLQGWNQDQIFYLLLKVWHLKSRHQLILTLTLQVLDWD